MEIQRHLLQSMHCIMYENLYFPLSKRKQKASTFKKLCSGAGSFTKMPETQHFIASITGSHDGHTTGKPQQPDIMIAFEYAKSFLEALESENLSLQF